MYFVDIRRNADKTVRRYPMTALSWDEGSGFWWSDGNMSCDCNRKLYFARAVGEEAENPLCGETAYSVRCLAENGITVLYEDDDWAPE